MTIDEIIKHYEQVLEDLKAYKEQSGDCISRQAAISAIMGEYPDAHYPSYYKSKIDELPSITPQPCGDAISRQVVLEGIRNLYPDIPIVDIIGARRKWLDKYAPYFECENVVEQLPSVTPQPKMGRWILIHRNGVNKYVCSECDNEPLLIGENYPIFKLSHYCPYCGTKMKVGG
jgi:hypothetical protein